MSASPQMAADLLRRASWLPRAKTERHFQPFGHLIGGRSFHGKQGLRVMFRSEFVDRSISVFALFTVLLATSLVAARGLNFGADFAGAMFIQVHFPEAARAESVRDK
jgi:hypothetical protein